LTRNEKIQLNIVAEKIRLHAVDSIYRAASGHPGGSLSICEMLSVLYFRHMRIDAQAPRSPERDRLVLSKGHAAPAYYAALALRGYFPVEELEKLRTIGSFLQGHPCMRKVPGVDMSSGSLGQGLSAANGMALAGKMDGKGYRVYCITGDGEMEEGQFWEATMTSAHYKLDNLTLLVDANGLQIDGPVSRVMNDYPLDSKLKAFNWNVLSVDGHDVEAIEGAIAGAETAKNMPTAIICTTTKGRGVSFMENQAGWHGAAPSREQYEKAAGEISARIAAYEGMHG
jgi:transketolase